MFIFLITTVAASLQSCGQNSADQNSILRLGFCVVKEKKIAKSRLRAMVPPKDHLFHASELGFLVHHSSFDFFCFFFATQPQQSTAQHSSQASNASAAAEARRQKKKNQQSSSDLGVQGGKATVAGTGLRQLQLPWA